MRYLINYTLFAAINEIDRKEKWPPLFSGKKWNDFKRYWCNSDYGLYDILESILINRRLSIER